MAGAIETISAGGRATIEYRFQHKDGIYRWIAEDTEFLCTRDGVPLYRFGFLRDITEKKVIAECAGANTELFVSEAEHAQGWDRGRIIGALATAAGILAVAAGLVYRTSVGEDHINSASSEIARKLSAENAALRTATEDLRVKIEVLVEERGRLTEEIAAKDRLVAGLTEQRNTARQARAVEPKQTEPSAAPEPHRIPIPGQPAITQVASAIDFRQSAAADVVVRPAEQPRVLLVQPVAPDPPSVR